MKRLFRHAATQAVLGWLLGAYLRLLRRSLRWRLQNAEAVAPALGGEAGAVGLFWHGRMFLILGGEPPWQGKRIRGFVSPSADGEFIARGLEHAGYPSIRGSSAKKGDAAKARAVAAPFREAVAWVKGGGGLVFTPDGPRGPAEVIAGGALQIARRSGAPVVLMGLAATPAWRLKTWDGLTFPLPFGRGAVVFDGPFYAPADADEAALAALARDWSARLSAATRRAEALAAAD